MSIDQLKQKAKSAKNPEYWIYREDKKTYQFIEHVNENYSWYLSPTGELTKLYRRFMIKALSEEVATYK